MSLSGIIDELSLSLFLLYLYLWGKNVKKEEGRCPVDNSPKFKECECCKNCVLAEAFRKSMER